MYLDEKQRLGKLEDNLKRRMQILGWIRSFFNEQGFLEVETPVFVPAVAPERYIKPVECQSGYLSTSPELYMKRMLAAGYAKIYQISRCFRDGEKGRQHNPEFSLLEWYRAGADYLQMIKDTENLFHYIAMKLSGKPLVRYMAKEIDLMPPWKRITVQDAFITAAGWDPLSVDDEKRFDDDLVLKVIPSFPSEQPMVLMDYPAKMASLARIKENKPEVAERAEFFISGLEMANAYSELTDPLEQASRFAEEKRLIETEQNRRVVSPDKFLESMKYLPACAGNALGIDRLVMFFCNTDSIQDVIPFTADMA
ncbi:EF-P lysine aminoacylase GenX [Dehalococcoides mccartyi]|uniref:amino acid--tRNA ligase-related protein n=1 Tax=Dehalococcoides mccartyi TaxID=61435 RepID=UPI00098EFFFB|nr:amino acid--tRNA ligase-related protein [Dehalococcoides mccartyi]AQU03181.1 EF-P lysine aminoacylase GenX [Dehalococcoides mccartyi]AQU04498.1 EF-P lysine aminoacylase GenX [Dehalococcoides mccartyi]